MSGIKLPPLNKSSDLGSGPDLGLAKKGMSIEARPEHMLERKIAPKVLGGTPGGHGGHIKALGMKGPSAAGPGAMSGTMLPIPGAGM